MLVVQNKRYIKKHVVGGAGVFDTVSGFFKRLIASNAAKSLATNLSRAAASDVGKSAINAAKTVGKELATSAISSAKDIAIERGKRLTSKVLTSEPSITQRSKDILKSLANTNLNRGLRQQTSKQAVRIEDLVRRLNGGGLRLA